MADQTFTFDQLPQGTGVGIDDLLALYRGTLIDGVPTHKISPRMLFNSTIGQYVHVAYADSLDEEDNPVGFTLTYTGTQNYFAFLVADDATPNPVAADFAGRWLEAPHGFLAHRENVSNPHEVKYNQLLLDDDEPMEVVTQAEAEGGTAETPRWWTAQRVAQAIVKLAEAGGVGGTVNDLRQLTESGGEWKDPLGVPLVRDWDNPTLYFSTGDPAVLPPLNNTTGMRSNLDRYERINEAPPALLVVANAGSPDGVDSALRTRLEELGFAVTYHTQTDAPPAAGEYIVAVLAESTSNAGLHTDWDTSATPIVTGEVFSLDTLRLLDADASAEGAESAQSITIAAAGHEAAGDISDGTLVVYSTTNSFAHLAVAGLPAGAVALGEKSGDASRATVVVYETGATLTSGTAPARRVFSGILYRADLWTDDAKELFDGLVYWAAGYDY